MGEPKSASLDSAAKPATLSLTELSQRSASIGTWQVGVFHPITNKYHYFWEGKRRNNVNFCCYLVSANDQSHYCLAEAKPDKAGDEKSLKPITDKFTAGVFFNISNVSLVKDVKKQYTNTPIQLSVNLRSTKATPVLQSLGNVAEPAPQSSIADAMDITVDQQFDVTALIQSMSEQKAGGAYQGIERKRVELILVDGSKMASSGKTARLPLTVFADATASQHEEPALFKNLRGHQRICKAVSFFKITGARGKEGFSFTSARGFHHLLATTLKAQDLNAQVENILGSESEDIPKSVLQSRNDATTTDYSNEPGIETTCSLFKSIMKTSKVSALESDVTVWQINWARVQEPAAGMKIRTNDGQRIWFQTTVLDTSGQITLPITEKAALRLSGSSSSDEFEQAFQDNHLWFPQMASIKLIRKPVQVPAPSTPNTSSAAKPEEHDGVNCFIIDAEPQNLSLPPTEVSKKLIPLLNTQPDTSDAVLPVSLPMLRKSAHYGLKVIYQCQGQPVARSCAQALALVLSSSQSKMLPVGTEANAGFKLVTNNLCDLLDDSGYTCSLTTFCSMASVPNQKLDPPRSTKTQAALILVSDILQESPPILLADSIQLLTTEEAKEAAPILKKLMHFTALACEHRGEKRSHAAWTEEHNPASASKCRNLGRSPTGSSLPEYTPNNDTA